MTRCAAMAAGLGMFALLTANALAVEFCRAPLIAVHGKTKLTVNCRRTTKPEASAAAPATATAPAAPAAPAITQGSIPALNAIPKIDPATFFQRIVERYHHLEAYKDTASVVQITQRQGEESSRVETQIACEISDGKLRVQTPASQTRKGLGLDVPVKQSKPVQDAQQRYDLWLAPHMALKFTEEPLKDLRAGVDEGFTATQAEAVTIDNKQLVHVALRSGDGLSDDCSAKFDLYVNSDSMLIERIDGEQKLPDGVNYSTSLHITPQRVEGGTPSGEPTAAARDPAMNPRLEPTT